MLAAMNGYKDVVLILTQKGANLDLVNKVSVHVHMLYEKGFIIEGKIWFTIIIKFELLSFKNIPNMMYRLLKSYCLSDEIII